MNYTAIKVDDYWVIVSDENSGNWFLYEGKVENVTRNTIPATAMKIIATSKKISDELPLFDVPEWDDSINIEVAAQQYVLTTVPHSYRETEHAWKAGFNTAKEKYQFTLEDMEKAFASGMDAQININELPTSRHRFDKFIKHIAKPKQYQVEIGSVSDNRIEVKSWKEI